MVAVDDLPGRVWHYTSSEGLLGIVKGGCLWASAPMSMNDVGEFEYGVDIIQRVWESIRPEVLAPMHEKIDESLEGLTEVVTRWIYVLSASADQDSLPQWRGYAGLQGYALELQTDVPLDLVGREGDLVADSVGNYLPSDGWYRVIYDRGSQERVALAALQEAMAVPVDLGRLVRWTAIQKILAEAAVRLKHPSFESEHEVRFIYSRRLTESFDEGFRSGRYGITPYVRLKVPLAQSGAPGRPGPVPITKIQCGPTGYEATNEVAAASVRRLVQGIYPFVEVSTSSIPFRP
ncbi:DUF2971 domain-containing protein [Leifsonia sp. ZF2019]|uniref:DUF2971 domain-containing protein n=1 Tax=Leifsonia sp. ZF2019 TaxID=2781978 RepID=UPI001CBF3FC6|nr:DUF2971 domain-containing protein [Leifsonia sp. ZF2019]UAJ79186.1 DUF2971 domain-containing protein [Leifsonia sp. ZF2019]